MRVRVRVRVLTVAAELEDDNAEDCLLSELAVKLMCAAQLHRRCTPWCLSWTHRVQNDYLRSRRPGTRYGSFCARTRWQRGGAPVPRAVRRVRMPHAACHVHRPCMYAVCRVLCPCAWCLVLFQSVSHVAWGSTWPWHAIDDCPRVRQRQANSDRGEQGGLLPSP